MTEEAFYELVKRHDLTYAHSDDHRIYERGRASLAKIEEAAKQLPPEVARRIWNEVVDLKLAPGTRESFYWMLRTVEASS